MPKVDKKLQGIMPPSNVSLTIHSGRFSSHFNMFCYHHSIVTYINFLLNKAMQKILKVNVTIVAVYCLALKASCSIFGVIKYELFNIMPSHCFT